MALLNLRDVSSSAGTAPLAPTRLFRSGQPYDLTEADIASIEGRVDTIVDLRDPREVRPGEWQLMERHGARVVHIPLAGQILAGDTEVEQGSPEADDDPLGAFYVAILAHGRDAFAAVARSVAAADGALLHCAAGKDRTGVATAMMLNLIGVGDEAIVGDYERTNEAMAQVIAQLAVMFGAQGDIDLTKLAEGAGAIAPDGDADDSMPSIPAEFLTAPASAIEAFLRALDQRGGARSYLSAAGLGSGELDDLVAKLTSRR